MSRHCEILEDRRLLSGHPAHVSGPPPLADQALSAADVQTILAAATSQALPTQAVVVVDREGTILGLMTRGGLVPGDPTAEQILVDAAARARTAAFFQSSGEAFTTRTARFIVQDHFPWPVHNTPGGPLYGVEFSSLRNSDVLLNSSTPAISGDPGGIPLYKNGVPVGGVGVAGDFNDVAARPDFVPLTQGKDGVLPGSQYDANPTGRYFLGNEESDYDEAVAMAGAQGYMAPLSIRATQIFIDGLRLPFIRNGPSHQFASATFAQITSSGYGSLRASVVLGNAATISAGEPEKDNFSVLGVPGLLRMHSNVGKTDPESNDPIVGAQDGVPNGLTSGDVLSVIQNAVHQAVNTRAGIRKPNGVKAVVHVVVVDTKGNVLGAFRMHDGTNFSYDVAVQKARTAAFFSDNTHAFSCRAVGFMSQAFFPPGIPHLHGPLYQLQDQLDVNGAPGILKPSLAGSPIRDGITIFPGGEPLYKNGVLVGAVGVSGDGVDQDDIISYAGTLGFRPTPAIRSDQLASHDIADFITAKVAQINALAGINFPAGKVHADLLAGLSRLRLPYVKFPRNPEH